MWIGKDRNSKREQIAGLGVAIAVVFHWFIESETGYQDHVSLGVGLLIACLFGALTGLAIRYITKLIVRERDE